MEVSTESGRKNKNQDILKYEVLQQYVSAVDIQKMYTTFKLLESKSTQSVAGPSGATSGSIRTKRERKLTEKYVAGSQDPDKKRRRRDDM